MSLFKKYLRNQWCVGCVLIVVTVIFVAILNLLGLFKNLELKSYDLRMRLRGSIPVEESGIVLVTIDDQTFTSLKKKWPFPRSYFARVFNNLAEAGAALIVVDVEFTEPSDAGSRDDLDLVETIKKYPNIILAGKLVTEFGSHKTVNRYPMKPVKQFLRAGAKWAYANVYLDEDGFIRRYNLFQDLHGQTYFPLTIEALLYLQNLAHDKIITNDNDFFKIGNFSIPTYELNSMIINFTGPAGHFPTYSMVNILDDSRFTLPDEDEDTDVFDIYKEEGIFKDKIVYVGASADELQDNKLTPFFNYDGIKQMMPGVEMHANAMYTIINNIYIKPVGSWIVFLIISIFATVVLLISTKLKPTTGLLIGLGVFLIFLIFCSWAFIRVSIWIPFVYPVICFITNYGVNIVYHILVEQREKGRYRKTFQQYVARSVVDTMLATGELPKFGGERKVLTVLFSDIRSFTTYSEKYPPEVVVHRLTEYLSSMVDVIFKNEGTLDKFVGDEIMALFGAPYYYENHAERACNTALEMISELRHIQIKWSQQQMEYFQIGIGINTGKVIAGNLGSIQLFDYTVIGDEVNLGARLEGANKQYSTTIIISDSTYQEVKDKVIARELDNVRVKGKKRPVKIYELRGMHSLPSIEKELIIDAYAIGLELFKQKSWSKALREFRRVLRYFPSDGPSRIYTQRCLEFIEHPPAENWDGIFDFEVK
jgi:adenylate cyclase